jgi:hypothetical protein
MKMFWLVGCVMLASCGLNPTKFDNVEYNNVVKLSYLSDQGQDVCASVDKTAALQELQHQSSIVTRYIINTRETVTVKQSVMIVDKQVNELAKAYSQDRKPSASYCENKFVIINLTVNSILATLGSKQR